MKIFIWGTGKAADFILNQCNVFDIYDVLGFIDNDVSKKNSFFRGKRCFLPSVLDEIKPDKIIVLTDFYEEIKRQIADIFPDMKILLEDKNFFWREAIITRYGNVHDQEIEDILEYIKKNGVHVFNYNFVNKYKDLAVDVKYDSACGMFYVYHTNRKLYFARFLNTEKKVRAYYLSLLTEQDPESPHRYLSSDFCVDEGDITVDVGAADGNFSLEIIDKVSRAYLIEENREWIEALRETFKDYQEKIVIIHKFAASVDYEKFATLDNLIFEPVNFIKMDIEGSECDVLFGSEKLIRQSKRLRCAICSYHGNSDETLIKDLLGKYELKCSTTSGYMWWLPSVCGQTYMSARLRRGIVRGEKQRQEHITKEA